MFLKLSCAKYHLQYLWKLRILVLTANPLQGFWCRAQESAVSQVDGLMIIVGRNRLEVLSKWAV